MRAWWRVWLVCENSGRSPRGVRHGSLPRCLVRSTRKGKDKEGLSTRKSKRKTERGREEMQKGREIYVYIYFKEKRRKEVACIVYVRGIQQREMGEKGKKSDEGRKKSMMEYSE